MTVHRSIFSSYVTVHPQHRSIFCSHGGCQHCAASPHLQLSGVPVARGAVQWRSSSCFLLSRINFSLGKLNPSSTACIFTLLSLGKIMHYVKPAINFTIGHHMTHCKQWRHLWGVRDIHGYPWDFNVSQTGDTLSPIRWHTLTFYLITEQVYNLLDIPRIWRRCRHCWLQLGNPLVDTWGVC